MSYKTIKEEATIEFEEKKSVFIGNIKRVENEVDAREFINGIKSKYKEARHNVFAYIIGENCGIQRYSDDGEPQGTAGIPVLEVIKKNNLTDVVVVVTRYFGGILLGAGGLTRAYSKTAALSVNSGGILEKVKGVKVDITIEYDNSSKIQYLISKSMLYIEESIFTDKVMYSLNIEISELNIFKDKIIEITKGKCSITTGEIVFYFKFENRLYRDF